MIAAGVLDDPHVDEVYGLHLTTLTAAGHVEVRPGPSMASCDYFEIDRRGQGRARRHAASVRRPDDRRGEHPPRPQAPGVPRGGRPGDRGGHGRADPSAGRRATSSPRRRRCAARSARSSDGVRAQLKERLGAYAADIARAYRTEARVRFEGGATPTVVNHDAQSAFVRAVRGERGRRGRGRRRPPRDGERRHEPLPARAARAAISAWGSSPRTAVRRRTTRPSSR